MDQDTYAWVFEIGKSTLGLIIIFVYGDWFLISNYSDYLVALLQAYFLISSFIVLYFSFYEKKKINFSIN